jgi:hypothetical protein
MPFLFQSLYFFCPAAYSGRQIKYDGITPLIGAFAAPILFSTHVSLICKQMNQSSIAINDLPVMMIPV